METSFGVGGEVLDLTVSDRSCSQGLPVSCCDGGGAPSTFSRAAHRPARRCDTRQQTLVCIARFQLGGGEKSLTSPETVTGEPSDSWVKVMTPVTEESPLRTATACGFQAK